MASSFRTATFSLVFKAGFVSVFPRRTDTELHDVLGLAGARGENFSRVPALSTTSSMASFSGMRRVLRGRERGSIRCVGVILSRLGWSRGCV